jgi:imidazolonepropionase-like amidohydrolase
VEEGVLADLLLIGGDPLANNGLIADPNNFKIMLKDGVIYKSTLSD